MRKTSFSVLIVIALAVFAACNSQPDSINKKIDLLKQQVTSDAKTLQDVESNYSASLKKDFVYCDSLLQHLSPDQVEDSWEQLNLTNAYLIQFSEVKPVMERKMDYVIQQLDHLKTDVETHYLSDSLATVYFETEKRVADTLHAQLEYFQDRFKGCQKALDQLKKSNR